MTGAVGTHLFWITSRAAGTVALLSSSAAVCAGLLMSGRLSRRRIPDLRVIHEMLSLTTIVAIVLHGVALLGDSYLRPTIADISIPFASSYKTFWTSMGIVAGWGIVLLGISFYARARIGIERWRVLHRFTALAWILGIAHSLGEGTDAGRAWFVAVTLIAVAPVLAMLALRWGWAERPAGLQQRVQ
jgi:sulfoxide reductase heme-binding subunit YedZ